MASAAILGKKLQSIDLAITNNTDLKKQFDPITNAVLRIKTELTSILQPNTAPQLQNALDVPEILSTEKTGELLSKTQRHISLTEEALNHIQLDVKTFLKRVTESLTEPAPPSNSEQLIDAYKNHAQAINTLKKILEETSALAKENTSRHHHHHDGQSKIALDLDEAVHGVYASSKYLISVFKGNPQAIAAEFTKDADELAHHTLSFLRDELIPHGIGELAPALGVSAIMIPLAYMAAKAGLEEMHHASHEIKDLKAHKEKLGEIQSNLKQISSILESKYIKTEQTVVESKQNVIQRAIKQAKRDWKIGLCSFGSGVSIGTKALSDIGLKISLGVQGLLTGKGFLGMGQVVGASTTAGVATTVLGVASTFVMGPLAGLFATGLGAYFTRKSTSKLNQLKTDLEVAKTSLDSVKDTSIRPSNESSTPFTTYKEFIDRQGKKRTQFFRGFSRWNKAFMIGSGLYAASATTKAIVAGVALGGFAAAASNPIGLGIITAVGTVGALGMGIASYCFFTGHERQGKFSNHTAGDSALVDRDLLVRAQAHYKETTNPTSEQFSLASACLTRLNARKNAIRGFLTEAAAADTSQTKKGLPKISPLAKTEDGKKPKDAQGKTQLTFLKRLKGQGLNVKDVEKYTKNHQNVLNFAQKDLMAEKTFLKTQLEAIQSLAEQASTSEFKPVKIGEGHLKPAEQFLRYKDEQLTEKTDAIKTRLEDVDKLLMRIDSGTEYPTAEQLLTHWGVKVKGKTPEKRAKAVPAALADYLLNDMDEELRNARGVLFETQLQASKLVKENPKQ